MIPLSTTFLGGGTTGEGDTNHRKERGKRYISILIIIVEDKNKFDPIKIIL